MSHRGARRGLPSRRRCRPGTGLVCDRPVFQENGARTRHVPVCRPPAARLGAAHVSARAPIRTRAPATPWEPRARAERLSALTLGSRRSLLNVSPRSAASTEKCRLPEKRPRNLTTFAGRDQNDRPRHSAGPALTSAHAPREETGVGRTRAPPTPGCRGRLRAGHWPGFLSHEAPPEISFTNTVPLGAHFSDKNGSQNLLLV